MKLRDYWPWSPGRETGDCYILRGRESGTQYPSTTVPDAVRSWVSQGLVSLAVTITCCYRHLSKLLSEGSPRVKV